VQLQNQIKSLALSQFRTRNFTKNSIAKQANKIWHKNFQALPSNHI